MTKIGLCLLCQQTAELQHGHVIPKFVSDWQKSSSATGYIRNTKAINRRFQDGDKAFWLCRACEQLLGSWEAPTAQHVYHPCNRRDPRPYDYGPWLLKFATSVSWRTVHHLLAMNQDEFLPQAVRLVHAALRNWREFLRGQRPHPGVFEQHMILFDQIGSMSQIDPSGLPGNFNRFLVRGTCANMAHTNGHPLFVFSKMGRMCVVGFIGVKYPRHWKGTKLHVNSGHVGGTVGLPVQFLDYLKSRAEKLQADYDAMSSRQRERISQAYHENEDRALDSELFEATLADVEMFGEEKTFRYS